MTTPTRASLVLCLLALGGLAALRGAPAEPAPAKQPAAPKVTTLLARPKSLSAAVSRGITFLIMQQQPDGGWGAADGTAARAFVPPPGGFGPGVRPVGRPRVPPRGGKKMPQEDAGPSDVANTSIVTLALLRAGSNPGKGKYAKNIARALDYVCDRVEASDKDSLSVKDGTGAQIQRKIGADAGTFLAALVLAEARDRMPDARAAARVAAALEKVVKKMEKNQKEDGTWGGQAWAPVLSQALASRALNRARQVGVEVDEKVLERAARHAREQFEKTNKANSLASPRAGTQPPRGRRPGGVALPVGRMDGGLVGAAGVSLYAFAASVGPLADYAQTRRYEAENARAVLSSPGATEQERKQAKVQINLLADVEKDLRKAVTAVARRASDPKFMRGFGSDGGEEFLSFVLIGETLLATRNREWRSWDRAVTARLNSSQNRTGSWSGKHCITGQTFCTSTALLALMADRAPAPPQSAPAGRK